MDNSKLLMPGIFKIKDERQKADQIIEFVKKYEVNMNYLSRATDINVNSLKLKLNPIQPKYRLMSLESNSIRILLLQMKKDIDIILME